MPGRGGLAVWKDASNSDPWGRMRLYGLCKTGSWGALACRGGHPSRRYRRLWPRRGKLRRWASFRRNPWLFFQRGGSAARTCYYNWINQLSNTTIWWLDICCLLHRYQLHVSALMANFRLIDWQQTCKQLYFGMCLVYCGGGLGLDGGTRSRVCWVGRVMWVHGYYCAGLTWRWP